MAGGKGTKRKGGGGARGNHPKRARGETDDLKSQLAAESALSSLSMAPAKPIFFFQTLPRPSHSHPTVLSSASGQTSILSGTLLGLGRALDFSSLSTPFFGVAPTPINCNAAHELLLLWCNSQLIQAQRKRPRSPPHRAPRTSTQPRHRMTPRHHRIPTTRATATTSALTVWTTRRWTAPRNKTRTRAGVTVGRHFVRRALIVLGASGRCVALCLITPCWINLCCRTSQWLLGRRSSASTS